MPKPSRQLRQIDIDALEPMEGKVPYVYDDAVAPTRPYKRGERIRGNLTAGVGHLLSKGPIVFPEANQWIGKTIPESQIEAWLDADNDVAENAVIRLVKVVLNSNQFAALVFFVFNVGVGAFENSTLLRKLNTGDYDAVPDEMRKWTKTTIDGVKVNSPGLVNRRSQEITYWNAPAHNNPPKPLPRPTGKPSGTQIGEKAPTGLAALFAALLGLLAILFNRKPKAA